MTFEMPRRTAERPMKADKMRIRSRRAFFMIAPPGPPARRSASLTVRFITVLWLPSKVNAHFAWQLNGLRSKVVRTKRVLFHRNRAVSSQAGQAWEPPA
jgi:hypothetical protein